MGRIRACWRAFAARNVLKRFKKRLKRCVERWGRFASPETVDRIAQQRYDRAEQMKRDFARMLEVRQSSIKLVQNFFRERVKTWKAVKTWREQREWRCATQIQRCFLRCKEVRRLLIEHRVQSGAAFLIAKLWGAHRQRQKFRARRRAAHALQAEDRREAKLTALRNKAEALIEECFAKGRESLPRFSYNTKRVCIYTS